MSKWSFRTTLGIALAFTFGLSPAFGAGGNVALLDARVNLEDRPSLQRGAKYFVNYCLSCHGASFMRYNRMAKDIGITDEQLKANLMFAGEKVGDKMTVAMRPEDATKWFNSAPPDLSVIARARGADWLYTYLLAFYQDDNPARPFGVNNALFTDVAMPHVLVDLQGIQVRKPEPKAKKEGSDDHEQDAAAHVVPRLSQVLELKSAGSLNPSEYRRVVRDLVNFMVYLGEPAKLHRYQIGMWVLVFIAVFFLLARALKKEYWRDVH